MMNNEELVIKTREEILALLKEVDRPGIPLQSINQNSSDEIKYLAGYPVYQTD